MVENLKRFREPAAWVMIALAVISIGLGVTRVVLDMTQRHLGLPQAMQDASSATLGLALLVAMCAAALSCVVVRPITARARGVVLTAAIVATVGTVLSAAMTVGGLLTGDPLWGEILEGVGGFVELAVKTVGVALLWTTARRVAARVGPAEAPALAEPDAPRTLPTWSADQASGAVWRTAGDAASGAAASGVGRKGTGWAIEAAPAEPDPLDEKLSSKTGESHGASKWAEDAAPEASDAAAETEADPASRWKPRAE